MHTNLLRNIRNIRQWHIFSVCLGILIVVLMGCQSQVPSGQLDDWHKEAIAENTRLTQLHGSKLTNDWKLRIQGQVQNPIELNWAAIENLSTTTISSYRPHPGSVNSPVEFRGISLKSLLEQAEVQSGVEEVTIVAADAYYTTQSVKNLIRNQGLLAILEGGKPIPRGEGGPVHLVFYNDPTVDASALDQQSWVYYTTHIIVGTESLKLKVAEKTLALADLEKLPTQAITTLVGYKHGWESEPVKLIGVKLQDILINQNLKVPSESIVKIRRKSMDDLDPQKSVLIPANILDKCDVILAYQWGADAQNIPARKGGPLTLAYGKNCPNNIVKDLAWLPFVESISVESIASESKGAKP